MQLEELIPQRLQDSDTLLRFMAEKLAALYAKSPEELMLLLYQLDIDEKKLGKEAHDFNSLAATIYQRQLEKIKTRTHFKMPPPDDHDLKW